MCCLVGLMALLGPRIALAFWWIFGNKVDVVFSSWVWPLLGLIFLPWTTLMYTIVWSAAGGVHGANWIAVALGVFLDLLSYSSKQAQKMRGQRGGATY